MMHILFSPYSISCLLFLIDVSLFFLFELQPVYVLLAYLFTTTFGIFTRPQLSLMLFLLALESFLFYNVFGLSLLYLIPLLLIARRIQPLLYANFLYPMTLGLLSIFIEIFVIEGYFLGLQTPQTYTMSKIAGTLILIGIFSLKTMGRNKTAAYS